MKAEYNFTRAKPGKFAGRVPANAVFVQFDADVSELLVGPGDLSVRLRALLKSKAKGGKRPRVLRTIVLTPTEYRSLKPVLDRLGGRCIGDEPSAARPRRRRAG